MPKTKILVVEDGCILAKQLKDILEELGYAVPALCASGEAAIEKTAETQPDLVLMDIVLKGGMDGVQAAEHIRERFDIPLVYLTGHSDDGILQRAKITEPFGYVLKPFDVRELHSNIQMALYKHRMERRLREGEDKLRSFMDSAAESFTLWDSELNLVMINQAGMKFHPPGTRKEDLGGKNIRDILPGLEGTDRYDQYLKVIETGEPFLADDVVPHPRFGDVHLTVRAFKVGDGLGMTVTDITGRVRMEETLRERTHDLGERVKELNCLYSVTTLVGTPEIPLKKVLQGIVDLVPSGMQYPDEVCARIVFEDDTFETANFESSKWRQAADILIQGERKGELEVCLLKEKPERDGGPFQLEERLLLNTIAEELGATIERRRLDEMTRRRTKELEAIAQVSTALRKAETRGEMLPIMITTATEVLNAEEGTLFLREDDALVVAAGQNIEKDLLGKMLPQDDNLLWGVLDSGRPSFITGLSDARRMDRAGLEAVLPDRVASTAIVPLADAGVNIGLILVSYRSPREFSEAEKRILTAIAEVAGIALHRGRVLENLGHLVEIRTRDLKVLYELTTIASQTHETKDLLKNMLQIVAHAVGSTAGAIHLIDDGSETLQLAEHQGIHPQITDLIQTVPAEGGMWGRITKGEESLLITDLSKEKSWSPVANMEGMEAFIGSAIRVKGQLMGVLSLFWGSAEQFTAENIALLSAIADQVGVALENIQLSQRAERAAILVERQRLARDLHDSVTQSLYSMSLLAEGWRRKAQAAKLEYVAEWLHELGQTAQQSLREMRQLLYELRSADLDRLGFLESLRLRLDAVEGRSGIGFQFQVDGEDCHLPPGIKADLYYIAQEALNNSLKHASASSVEVYYRCSDGHIELEIADDGSGFEPGSVLDAGKMGLLNMRERAEKHGGSLTIQSGVGAGTRVKVNLPFELEKN